MFSQISCPIWNEICEKKGCGLNRPCLWYIYIYYAFMGHIVREIFVSNMKEVGGGRLIYRRVCYGWV